MRFCVMATLCLGLTTVALASPSPGPESCEPEAWRLEGAEQSSGGEASFKQDWVPALEQIAGCLGEEQMKRSCVAVQGRFDATPFDGPVGQAVGGQLAAQNLRARGRALRVLSWFYEAGIAPMRIRERPPPSKPSFRGVFVSLMHECLPAEQPPQIIVQERRAPPGELGEVFGAGRPPPPPQVIRVEIPRREDDAGPWFLAVGAGVGGLFADGVEDVARLLTRVGAGWAGELSYAHLDGGLTLGSEEGQARGWETSFGTGWYGRPWLQLGVRLGHRISGADFTAPWADQAWFAGLEAVHCLDLTSSLEFCAEEFLGGGQWDQRAVEVDRTLYFVPQEERLALLLGLTLSVRQGL